MGQEHSNMSEASPATPASDQDGYQCDLDWGEGLVVDDDQDVMMSDAEDSPSPVEDEPDTPTATNGDAAKEPQYSMPVVQDLPVDSPSSAIMGDGFNKQHLSMNQIPNSNGQGTMELDDRTDTIGHMHLQGIYQHVENGASPSNVTSDLHGMESMESDMGASVAATTNTSPDIATVANAEKPFVDSVVYSDAPSIAAAHSGPYAEPANMIRGPAEQEKQAATKVSWQEEAPPAEVKDHSSQSGQSRTSSNSPFAEFTRIPDVSKDVSKPLRFYIKLQAQVKDLQRMDYIPHHRFLVAIIPDGKSLKSLRTESDMFWYKCNKYTTVKTVRIQYGIHAMMTSYRLVLGEHIAQDSDTLQELDFLTDHLIVLRAIKKEDLSGVAKSVTDSISEQVAVPVNSASEPIVID